MSASEESNSSNMSDEELLALLQQRDETAMQALYERYFDYAYRVAYRILREPDLAMGVVGDAFVHLYSRAAKFEPGQGNLLAWITIHVRNRALRYLRATRMQPRLDAPIDDIEQVPATDEAQGKVDLEGMVQNGVLRATLATLPEADRRVIEMAYFNGYTQQEIAAAMSVPVGTVKGRLRIGLAKMKSVLEDAEVLVDGSLGSLEESTAAIPAESRDGHVFANPWTTQGFDPSLPDLTPQKVVEPIASGDEIDPTKVFATPPDSPEAGARAPSPELPHDEIRAPEASTAPWEHIRAAAVRSSPFVLLAVAATYYGSSLLSSPGRPTNESASWLVAILVMSVIAAAVVAIQYSRDRRGRQVEDEIAQAEASFLKEVEDSIRQTMRG